MNFSRKFHVLLACSMAGTQIPTLKLLPLPLLWSWVSLEFLMTWMGISDHIEYILYWINWLWLQSHWIQCKRASKTGNFLPKVKMFIIWETLNFTWCFVHQTNSNCLNFHGIEWFYDWSRNKQVIQDQSCHSNCETPCIFSALPNLGPSIDEVLTEGEEGWPKRKWSMRGCIRPKCGLG